MANFALLWKARIIEKYRLEYEQEKINSMLNSNVEIPKNKLINKWSHYGCSTRKRFIEKFKNLYPEGSSVSNFFVYLTTDQTFPNFLMKSVIGFIGGIVFTYLCFMFFVFQLSISLMHATIMSSIIGVLLTLGLAFSYRVRCLTFLLIPQFFSRVGRYTLTCYALVLILTGPATNTLKNSEVLSESMACNQEQIKASVKHITDSIKNPFNAMKDWVKIMTEGIKGVAKKLKSLMVTTHRMVISIATILESSFPWLNTITNKCNSKLGTPYQHCFRILDKPDTSGKRQLHPKPPWTCQSNYLAHVSCYTLKRHKRICDIADYTRTTIVATMKKKLQTFAHRVQSLLSVKIHVHHSYSFSSNASRSASQVAAGIVTEIRNRADPLLTWLSWSSCVTSLFLLLIIFRAKNYQHMYETGSRFDNRYITKELRNLDFERLKEGKETILPLNRREKAKYITTTSFRLLASEKVYLTRSVVHMVITTFKLLIHMAADYSLYWVLMTIRYNWRFQTPLQPGPANAGVQIAGTGPVAEMLRSLLKYLTLPLSTPPSSSISCLPNPYPPDSYRYTQIGVLIFLLWFFALFEPYGLRLSHVIMGHYRPERAKARAMWLYNHILRSRVGFVKFARRKLHKDYKYCKRDEITFVQWLNSQLPCWWLRYWLGTIPKDPNCSLCGTVEVTNKPDSKLFRCDTPNCPGIYCNHCYNDLGLLCTICLSPVDYGDLSDVSMEQGSSEDSNSDCQDCDGQIDSEDEIFSQDIQVICEKQENLKEINKFLPYKDSGNKHQEDDLRIVEYNIATAFIPITFRRKVNMVRYLKNCSYIHNDTINIKAKKTSLHKNKVCNITNTKAYCQNNCNDQLKTTSANKFKTVLNIWKTLSNYFNESKNLKVLRHLNIDQTDNYKYKRKNKMSIRNKSGVKQRMVTVDYIRSKISKMRCRQLNVSNACSRMRVSSKIRSVMTKNPLGDMLTQFKPRYKLWKNLSSTHGSKYYDIKFKISKFVQCNEYAKKLRRNYKSVFRCKSKGLQKNNNRIFIKEDSTCSLDHNFIDPQNVAHYCKNLCFIKSSKNADGNSKRSLNNKKSNKTPPKAPDNNDVPKKNSPYENNEAGKGDKNDKDKLDNKSACYCMKHIRRLCFCRHKNFSLTPCSLFKRLFRKNSGSKCSSTTNHKRRKKDKSVINVLNPNKQGKLIKEKEDENARIYRLSTYIGQQEWMKGQFSKSNHIGLRKRKLFPTTSTQSLHQLKLHSGSKTMDVKLSKIGLKKSKNKDNAKKNTDNEITFRKGLYRNDENTKKFLKFENKKRLNQTNLLTHKWFNNYYSLLPNTSSLSLKTIMKANKTVNSVSDYGMSRSLRYYCSIGNTEFDQIDCPDAFKAKTITKEICKKEEIVRRSLKTESECSPFHSCCCSIEDLSNNKQLKNFKRFPDSQRGTSSINFNFKTEFELISKPVRTIKIKSIKHAMSDRFLHLKLRNPFPLVKDFYSSMLDAKLKKNNIKPKGIQDGKTKAVTVQPKRKSATCQFGGNSSQKKEKEVNTQNTEIPNDVPGIQNTADAPIQTDGKETQKPAEYTITSISNRSVIESSLNPRRRYAINTQSTLINRSISIFDEHDPLEAISKTPSNRESAKLIETINRGVETSETLLLCGNEQPNAATLPYTNTVGPSNLFQTVFRPSEHGSYVEDYHERHAKKPHKQLELSTPTPTYTPRKMQVGLKRDSRTKPYIFRPPHNEDNSPEDPTLPSHPQLSPLSQCSPLRRERESCQREVCKPSDQGEPEQPNCESTTREQSNVECSTETNTIQDTEAIAKMLENFEKSSGMDDLNQEDYKTNVMSPNCVFRLPLLKPVEPCLVPELESCPSVSKLDCEKGRRSKHDKQQGTRGRRANQKLTERLENQEKRIHERCQSQDRQDCRESCPIRDPKISQEKLEYIARQERMQRQEALKRRENQRRRELREEQLKKDKMKAKMAKRALERCDSNIIGCECDGGKRPLSKSTSTNLFTDSESKVQSKKGNCKSRNKSKSAICQCPPLTNVKLPRMKHIPPCPSMRSDTQLRSDDDSVETIPSCQKVKGRRMTKMVPKPIPTPFPRTTCRSFPVSRSETWTVHSDSDVGDALYHESPQREQSTNTVISERNMKSKHCVPATKDCCGCSDKPTPSSQSSPITCSKSSCCTCPSERKQGRKHKAKIRDRTPQRGMQDSDVSQTSVYRSSQQNLVKFCSRATDMSKPVITDSGRNLDEYTECPPKPVNKCVNKAKQIQCRTSKRRTIYRPSQVPTLPSAQRPSSVARRSDRSLCPSYPDTIGVRGSALSRLTEYPSSGDISGEPVVADRGCARRFRKFKAQGTCSPVDHCAAIKKNFYITPECNEDNDCNMCMQNASQGTRETGSGETVGCNDDEESCGEADPENKAPCEVIKSVPKLCSSKTSVKGKATCSNCQCHKRKKCFEVCQIPTQALQHWSTQIETEEIKGYLRSLCRNCQCDKETHKSQLQTDNCVPKNDISALRGYLQTTWRNCHCSKVKTSEETSTTNNCAPGLQGQPGQLIQSQSTTVGSVDIKTSLLSVCKNCQCIKKKIFLGGKAALRPKASNTVQVDGQQTLNTIDTSRVKDFAGSTCFPIAPTKPKEKMTLQTSYDTFPENLNTKPEPEKPRAESSTEAASLVEEIVKNQEEMNMQSLEKSDRYNSIPSFDEPDINKPLAVNPPPKTNSSALKIGKETHREKNEETTTDFTPVKDSRMVNKRVSAFIRKQSMDNSSQQAIFAPNVDACISLEHLIRDRSHSCQKRKCCINTKKFSSLRRRSKHVTDQSQIFPEKLSCGIDKVDSSPNTCTDPCQKPVECETLPKGCVPYRTLNDDQGVCIPSPCASQQVKNSCLDSEAIPEKLPKQCDKRVTVNSKIKTIEPPCSPPKPRRCDDQPIQTCPPTIKYKTRIIEAKPKTTQDCGCSTSIPPTPPAPAPSCIDYGSAENYNKIDKVLSSHKCKRALEPTCSRQKSVLKPAEKLPPGIKSRPSCNIRPPKQRDSCEMTEKKCRTDGRKHRRRSSYEERGSILKPSLSDTHTSKTRLRTSSMESFRSRPRNCSSDKITRIRHKSAPCNYPQYEEDESCLKPPEKVPVCKKLSDDCFEKPPRKLRSDRYQRKDSCKSAVKEKADTCDIGVEIRCPICTCATQCHDTTCYRSTEVKNKTYKKSEKGEKFLKRYDALDNEVLFSDFTSDENNAPMPTTTVCSRVTVDYCEEPPPKPAKICKMCYKLALKEKQSAKEKLPPAEKPPPKERSPAKVKKANQGTTTEKTRFRDVSTRTKGFFPFEKKKVNVKTPAKKSKGSKTCEKSICTEGRLVTFKSRTQVIPCCHDIMSPSRYLMESQRQYNEIISSKFTKCLCPALVNHQKYSSGFCASKIKQNSLRGHKARKQEYYLCKRQRSPRLSEDRTRSDDSTKPAIRLLKGLRRYRIRKEAKLNAMRKQRH